MIEIPNQKANIGFYFHIPFCPHICPYCDFTKTAKFSKKDISFYFDELEEQLIYFIENLKEYYQQNVTIYFGGGTPGLFEASAYKRFFNILNNYFKIEEATLETNPLTNFKRRLYDYRKIGFTRITLGAQSLCHSTLKILGRKHTPENVIDNLNWANSAGFNNIQVDLIYGLKKEYRSKTITEEINELVQNGATGISAYALTIEQRTLFAKKNYSDEDNAVNEYLEILKSCSKLSLQQVETSNFSRFPTKHNNLYWYGKPYIGLGTGSHGLLPQTPDKPFGMRYRIGPSSFQEIDPGNDRLIFTDKIERGKNFSIHYESPRTKREYIDEMIFTLLRTPNGIPFSWLEKYLNKNDFLEKINKNSKFSRAIEEKNVLISDNNIALSASEKIRGDLWASDFISLI
ncbi:radical SAM protein [Pigmentibacter sp. JX0631]|uniref:coproporphyrinogen-III oxidase family protein n=1 Tax=Pigmentibacter sp. JX0631 TaxID=2976982 RepID=UPI00246961B1|nr:radical SAM protein [Pigmentibacter sp. JX0631]WGL58939.1 radical SAM protein [Pigmentibacter sp. JX0631]